MTPSTKRIIHGGSLLKGVAVQGVLYQIILNAKLTGRKKLGRKLCTSNRDDRKLENTVKQSRFKHLGELHKEWTEAGVHQESPRSDIFRKTKPLLKQKHRQKHLTWAKEKKNWTVAQWSKVLFSDESKCCISFGNQGPRVWRKSGEAQNPCCLKSSVKFPQSVMIWAVMSSAGVGPLCFLKSTVNAAIIYQEILEHFMLASADELYGDDDFTSPYCQRYQKLVQWPWCYCVWLANSPDLNPIENLRGMVKRKMRDTRPNNADDLKTAIKVTWSSLHLSSATGWLPFFMVLIWVSIFIFVNCNNYAFCIVFKHCNVAFCHFCYWKTTVCGKCSCIICISYNDPKNPPVHP